jgi:CRISPR-associated endonuclease/helicase Cas3
VGHAVDLHQAEVKGRVDHSTAAAQLAVESFKLRGHLLAYCFAGHHAGLPDWDDGQSQSGLKQRLLKEVPAWRDNAPPELVDREFPPMPRFKSVEKHEFDVAAFRVAFWIRMIFSALVDADYLATESFMSPERQSDRSQNNSAMAELVEHLETHIAKIENGAKQTRVNSIRKDVGEYCKTKATLPPGFFSLCVPTGGGKTIASLRFALAHATEHMLDRVVVAVPFTSIIEQNAKVYRDIFAKLDPEVVLEHHSNLDPEVETSTNRLQAENWDAPLIVTTNVQLFESMFACRTSKCRKLHRLARSVIILDEAQTLPVELLKPTLLALRELVESFGCSVVLCSATQPALNWRDDFPIGLTKIRPIVDNSNELHQSLKRTQVTLAGKIEDDRLVGDLESESQVLCIVNTRPHAAELFSRLDQDDASFHLSTRMCAVHRQKTLDIIKQRLKQKLACRVISTQLIEAGVDIDFPVVYRASCGLDSLAQAAGRCNREGLLAFGRVVFFDAQKPPPVGFLRQSSDSAKELLDQFDDLLAPSAIEEYFRLHYWKKSSAWDQHEVLEAVGNQPSKLEFNFRQIADRYRFIRDDSETILIGWKDEGEKLVNQLENPKANIHRSTWRMLQRYSIQVRQHEFSQLQHAGALEKRHERWVLTQQHLYDEKLGLRLEKADGVLPVEDLIL